MAKDLSPNLERDLERARELHDRAASDYTQCLEFNRLMADLLDRLEDDGHHRRAGKVMTLLLECNPKEGARCDKATLVGEKVRKM